MPLINDDYSIEKWPVILQLEVPNTSYSVLWRKSMLHPEWSQGYGLTMVDFSSELFGLSTLWLGAEFWQNNTDHWRTK